MSRVQLIDLEKAKGDVAILYEGTTNLIGRVPNFIRALANAPLVAKFLIPFSAVLQREGAGSLLSSRIKEMIILKTSKLNGCRH